jgi:MFS family permease
VIASTVGTTIEWYDFLLYGQMAALVFAKLYFPSSDPLTGILQAFAVFAVGFVARPIGAAIFGHYGDRIGRKAALIATLLLTGLSTFLVGCVPTYEQIGVWGAVLLVALRFVRGSASAANGAARCCCRWSGHARAKIADSSRRGRNLAGRQVSSSRTSRSWRSVRCRGISS